MRRRQSNILWFWALVLIGAVVLFCPRESPAADDGWTFGLTIGAYKPALKTLNRVINTPGVALLQDPNYQLRGNNQFPAKSRNIVIPGFKGDDAFGFSLDKRFSPKNSVVVTLNVWDNVQESKDLVAQVTGVNFDVNNVPRSTRYNINVTQLWLGWRYDLLDTKDQKNRIFLDLGILGISYAQLTIDTLLRVDLPGDAFPIVSSLEAEGFGLTSRWGMGASYAINEWIGVSLRVAYVFGRVSNLRVNRFFPSGFSGPPQPTDPVLPPEEQIIPVEPLPAKGDRIVFADVETESVLSEKRENRRPLLLELDGYEALFALEFYF